MFKEFTDKELSQVPPGSVFVYDVESYPNYFCIRFREITTDKDVVISFSRGETLNLDKLRWFVWRYCLVGFNSNVYDIVMLTLALWGLSTDELKAASDKIILQNMRPYQMQKEYGIEIPNLNHMDLIEVAPLEASLKLYGGRLHCDVMQDLPYDPHKDLTEEEKKGVTLYCGHDLTKTKLLLVELAPHIELRQDLGVKYGRDLRSLSDAQVAEAIICIELYKVLGYYPRAPKESAESCRYVPPDYLQFKTPVLQNALKIICDSVFIVEDTGSITMPEAIKKLHLNIGGSVYKMGIGGLHSQEKEASYKADAETLLIDRDVASYYPAIILNQGLYPKHLGPAFLSVYKTIVDRRLLAKKAGNKKVSEGLKIAINGIFGKLGNMYSAVYSPDLMLQVTLTGQLSLLLLIESIELAGIPVVSGNTDGIVIKCPVSRYETLSQLIQAWETATGFTTEETRYRALYSRDVNNYIGLKEKPDEKPRLFADRMGCKVKGVYSEVGSAQNSVLSKNPESLVCNDAVMALLAKGTPIEKTIRACTDVRRFLNVRTVKGGATKNGQYLGRAIRWYYAKGESGTINYVTSGNKVPKSEGARPLMVLPHNLPSDLNYEHYIRVSEEMLFDIGYKMRPQSLKFF